MTPDEKDCFKLLNNCVSVLRKHQDLADGLVRLDALNLPPVSEAEVEAEIQASRQARRAQHSQDA